MTINKISIIIPVYNVDVYLRKCLDSVINQTLRDIEIICINDGSTDNSLKILYEYKEKDSRITVINQKNKGLGTVRNLGLDLSSSPYIMFVDSDDWLELEACEKMYNTIIQQKVDLVICNVNLHYELYPTDSRRKKDHNYFYKPEAKISNLTEKIIVNTVATAWNKLYKKELIDQFHIRFPEFLYYEDNTFTWKYLLVSTSIYQLEDQLYNYLIFRAKSIMTKTLEKNNLMSLDVINIFFDFYNYLEEHDLKDKYEHFLFLRFYSHIKVAINRLQTSHYFKALELAHKFLTDKDLSNLKITDPSIYEVLNNIKNKRYKKVIGKLPKLPNYTFLEKRISFLYTKKFSQDITEIYLLGIRVYFKSPYKTQILSFTINNKK